ncbi:hypothetical protein D3C79_1061460 [compost metagenome]
MGLVGHHCKAAGFQAGTLLNGLEHMGEGLDGNDDDGSATDQCLDQLGRLAALAFLPVDAGDDPSGVIKLGNSLL